MNRKWRLPQASWGGTTKLVGLTLAVYVVLTQQDPSWATLAFIATLIGIPFAVTQDMLRQRESSGSSGDGSPPSDGSSPPTRSSPSDK